MSFQLPVQAPLKGNAEKYGRIIHAAIRVFAKKGFFYAKVSDVAREADVADGTIYLYFKNKDDLLVSIFEHSVDYFIQQARSELAQLSHPEAKLKKFVELYLAPVKSFPELAQVLLVELRSSTKFMKEYKPTKLFEYLDILSEVIIAGQEQGVFSKTLNPQLIRRLIFGSLDEFTLEWVLSRKKRFEIDEAAQQIFQFILSGIKGSTQVEFEKESLKGEL